MKTSYFAVASKNPNAVAISIRKPPFFHGRHYPKLAPTESILNSYQRKKDIKRYEEQYRKQILSKLEPKEVYEELGEDAVLVCWEGPKKFCHRHIVAKWFEKCLGIKVDEL